MDLVGQIKVAEGFLVRLRDLRTNVLGFVVSEAVTPLEHLFGELGDLL